eukprot:6206584-Pleurochrysis_carterae.AAC.3
MPRELSRTVIAAVRTLASQYARRLGRAGPNATIYTVNDRAPQRPIPSARVTLELSCRQQQPSS